MLTGDFGCILDSGCWEREGGRAQLFPLLDHGRMVSGAGEGAAVAVGDEERGYVERLRSSSCYGDESGYYGDQWWEEGEKGGR
jgi:hypothetical protein